MRVFEGDGLRFEYPPDATVETATQDDAWSIEVRGPWLRGSAGAEGHAYGMSVVRLPNAQRLTASAWVKQRVMGAGGARSWSEARFAGWQAMRHDERRSDGVSVSTFIVATKQWVWCVSFFEPPAETPGSTAARAGRRILESVRID